MKILKTEIVKTKEVNKIFNVVFFILYLFATFYLFLNEKENQNIYLKYFSLFIYLLSAYFLFGHSFIKPKKIGNFEISLNGVKFKLNNKEWKIKNSELKSIKLKYKGYGSWKTHSIYGNQNYIQIKTEQNEEFNFEILIKNKKMKEDLNELFQNENLTEKVIISNFENNYWKF